MAEAVAIWHAEHVRFAKLLNLLEEQLAEFHDDGSPDYGTMLDIVSYLHDYPERYHHPREDIAFACLLRHEPDLKPVIHRLLQEHRVIGRAGESLKGLLEEVVSDAMVSRESIETAAATYLAYYRNHLNTEERDILPRARDLLDASDWEHVAQSLPGGEDPLFGSSIAQHYSALRRLVDGR